jgi:hypothetical protein
MANHIKIELMGKSTSKKNEQKLRLFLAKQMKPAEVKKTDKKKTR